MSMNIEKSIMNYVSMNILKRHIKKATYAQMENIHKEILSGRSLLRLMVFMEQNKIYASFF